MKFYLNYDHASKKDETKKSVDNVDSVQCPNQNISNVSGISSINLTLHKTWNKNLKKWYFMSLEKSFGMQFVFFMKRTSYN